MSIGSVTGNMLPPAESDRRNAIASTALAKTAPFPKNEIMVIVAQDIMTDDVKCMVNVVPIEVAQGALLKLSSIVETPILTTIADTIGDRALSGNIRLVLLISSSGASLHGECHSKGGQA